MTVQVLAGVALPGHDPDLASWLVTVLEAVTAVAAGIVFARLRPRRWRDVSFWAVVALVMVAFAVNKQLDGQSAASDPRLALQVLVFLSIGTLGLVLWGSSGLARYRFAVSGVSTLVAFALLRAADIAGISTAQLGHDALLPVEAGGTALVLVASIRQLVVHAAQSQATATPSS